MALCSAACWFRSPLLLNFLPQFGYMHHWLALRWVNLCVFSWLSNGNLFPHTLHTWVFSLWTYMCLSSDRWFWKALLQQSQYMIPWLSWWCLVRALQLGRLASHKRHLYLRDSFFRSRTCSLIVMVNEK